MRENSWAMIQSRVDSQRGDPRNPKQSWSSDSSKARGRRLWQRGEAFSSFVFRFDVPANVEVTRKNAKTKCAALGILRLECRTPAYFSSFSRWLKIVSYWTHDCFV